MDKQEFNAKTTQLITLHAKKDYKAAAEVADGLDLKKMKDLRLISIISDAYEETGQHDKAKELLSEAYDRIPMGRQLAYRLSLLSLRTGMIKDAQEYYEDFISMSPKDNGKYLLQYEIARAKGDSLEKQTAILEKYISLELDERWQYELAMLYNKMGQTQKCVDLCDEIILWFSEGTYVEKAMELKMLHTPLTRSQQERYEKRFQQEEETDEIRDKTPVEEESILLFEEENDFVFENVLEEPVAVGDLMEAFEEKQKKILEEARSEIEKTLQEVMMEETPEIPEEQIEEEEPQVIEPEEIMEEIFLEESLEELDETYKEIFERFLCIDGLEIQLRAARYNLVENYDREGTSSTNNLVVMGDAKSGRTSFAIKLIKEVNRERERRGRKIVKVKGPNLNGKDISNTITKLIGTDLIIERAASMSTSTVEGLIKAMKAYTGDMIIVFEDDNSAIERLLNVSPELKEMFPNVINIQGPGLKEWVEFASEYAAECGYAIDEMGRLALHVRVGNLCSTCEKINAESMEEIIDTAISKNKKGKFSDFFKRKKSRQNILREADFM